MSAGNFIVSSEVLLQARRPYLVVRSAHVDRLSAALASRLSDFAFSRISVSTAGHIDVSSCDFEGSLRLQLNGIGASDLDLTALLDSLRSALASLVPSAVELDQVECSVSKSNFLCSRGASFHTDTMGDWTSSLFWVLCLSADDAEFVSPLTGAVIPLKPGTLIVFDPSVPHGVCRPSDAGRFVVDHFASDDRNPHQAFLAGELLLPKSAWKALGSPWRQLGAAEFDGAKDLRGGIDEETGAVIGMLEAA